MSCSGWALMFAPEPAQKETMELGWLWTAEMAGPSLPAAPHQQNTSQARGCRWCQRGSQDQSRSPNVSGAQARLVRVGRS